MGLREFMSKSRVFTLDKYVYGDSPKHRDLTNNTTTTNKTLQNSLRRWPETPALLTYKCLLSNAQDDVVQESFPRACRLLTLAASEESGGKGKGRFICLSHSFSSQPIGHPPS